MIRSLKKKESSSLPTFWFESFDWSWLQFCRNASGQFVKSKSNITVIWLDTVCSISGIFSLELRQKLSVFSFYFNSLSFIVDNLSVLHLEETFWFCQNECIRGNFDFIDNVYVASSLTRSDRIFCGFVPTIFNLSIGISMKTLKFLQINCIIRKSLQFGFQSVNIFMWNIFFFVNQSYSIS